MKSYDDFLKAKVIIAPKFGIETTGLVYSEKLKPHQKDIVDFCLTGGRRAIFASFGLGKTFMQLEIAKQLILKEKKHFLIVCPLGVSGEFKRDNQKLNTELKLDYITNTQNLSDTPQIYLTNYERIRKGDIDASFFCGVSFDEASILRNLQTETTNYVLQHFRKIEYRFVATATPTPNDFIEILNYADYLGVASRGHLLTRFFKRDPQKAGNLKLYENKKDEFWKWCSTWAAFINTPADLGYDSIGYDLPKLNIIEHCIDYDRKVQALDKFGQPILFVNLSKSLLEVAREKRDSIYSRIDKTIEITKSINGNVIIWHHRNKEQELLEQNLKGQNYVSVFGSQKNEIKENNLIEFSEGKYKYLLTKPEIAGQGCNFQEFSSDMIFCGIDYKFNDFIQAIHRQYRFGQKKEVNVHIIYTKAESHVMEVLKNKWENHIELNKQMIQLVKENGLNAQLIKTQMERQIFMKNKQVNFENATLYNDDCVKAMDNVKENSVKLIVTSIPFGNHYEYSDNYNDFGHNESNEKFFNQMDYLVPKLFKSLDFGRIACIHVKDRVRYSYQNGTSFTSISDFSGQTVQSFEKHGFFLIGKITVTTDVVSENNQTYRLGWSEQCKDGSKMGVGLPEYILLFRKPPSSSDNAYSDDPVVKAKEDYKKSKWQLDAHSYYRSNGDRFLTKDEFKNFSVKSIVAAWNKYNKQNIYDFQEHYKICDQLDDVEKLSSTFMTLPVHSNNENVWTDVSRMNTLNARQVSSKKEKHICPLQLDIIERLIERYSNEGDIVLDPFGGLFSVVYQALKMKRKSISMELNSEYFLDGCFYVKMITEKLEAPKLFDMLEENHIE